MQQLHSASLTAMKIVINESESSVLNFVLLLFSRGTTQWDTVVSPQEGPDTDGLSNSAASCEVYHVYSNTRMRSFSSHLVDAIFIIQNYNTDMGMFILNEMQNASSWTHLECFIMRLKF